MTLHLKDFKSNEISVKVVDNSLVVSAEHEEKPDDHGHIYRHVKRRYVLPRNVDFNQVNATMSDEGTLVVCAPKKPHETVRIIASNVSFFGHYHHVIIILGERAQHRNKKCSRVFIGGFSKVGETNRYGEN